MIGVVALAKERLSNKKSTINIHHKQQWWPRECKLLPVPTNGMHQQCNEPAT
jgi:hypothetical protein